MNNEPVAWMHKDGTLMIADPRVELIDPDLTPLYTRPSKQLSDVLENIESFRAESIKSLMDMKSTAATAEAIAICLGSLKNKEGKLVGRINLSEDFAENMDFCHQIAKMLRGDE